MKKYVFLLSSFLLFLLIFSLFLFFSTSINDTYLNFLEFLLVCLVYLCFSANVFLSGTGIFIFISFCIFIFAFSSLIFSSINFIIAIPLLIIAQLIVRKQFDFYFNEKRTLLLEIEKNREQLNDKNDQLEQSKKKREVLDAQIQRFANLRDYIAKINLSLSKDYLIEMVLNFINCNLLSGDIYSIAFLSKNKLLTSSFIIREGSSDILFKPDKQDIVNEWIIKYWSPLRIDNVNEDFRFQLNSNDNLIYPLSKSIIASPLISDDKPMGVLRIDSVKKSQFSLTDFRLLVIISNISALSFRNADLFKQTQILSITDGLTGLFLPHHMFKIMKENFDQLNKSQYESKNISFLMMDLDHFKQINDTYGHVVGDNVLIKVAAIIKSFCPEGGLAVRYGGEELAIFLPGQSLEYAYQLSEKIRLTVHKKKIMIRRKKIDISISIGISSIPVDSLQTPKEMVHKADERLYLAKEQGRNRTVVKK